MSAYSVDLTSPTPLSKDGAPVAALDVHVAIALSRRVSISNPLGELQINASIEARVDDSGQSPRPQHAAEHRMFNGPHDTVAFTVGGAPVNDSTNPVPVLNASVGPAWAALNSASAIP